MATRETKYEKANRKWINHILVRLEELTAMEANNTLFRLSLECERCPDCQTKGFKIESLEIPVTVSNPMCDKHEKKLEEFRSKYGRFIKCGQ
jgi:hypothetical protein